tara:strand:+ start:671 stop:871 length:201 start_codon:yes stop_codon:yes gene_type:complete
MSKFALDKNRMLFEWLIEKGWQHEEAMHKMEGCELYINKHGNYSAKFSDGSTEIFAVEYVPKFFQT